MEYENTMFLPNELADDVISVRWAMPADASEIWAYYDANRDYFIKYDDASGWDSTAHIRMVFANRNADPNARCRYFVIKLGDAIIGTLNVWKIDLDMMSCEFGYSMSPQFSGHGYTTRAVKLMADALLKLGMVRLVIQADPENIPSMMVAKNAGFTPVGVSHMDYYSHTENRFCDTAIFEMLSHENAHHLEHTRRAKSQ